MRPLEDRSVPAALLVNQAGDAGLGSGTAGDIRFVWDLANSNLEDDVITFDASLNGSPLTLTSPLNTYTDVGSLTLEGNGAAQTKISGGGFNRIFTFNVPGVNPTITLKNLTLQDGNAPTGNGGAILANNDPLVIQGVTFDNNSVTSTSGTGGAISISTTNTLTITNSTFTNNRSGTSTTGSGGAISGSTSFTLDLTGSSFTGNTAGGSGGAIHAGSSTTMTINTSSFTANVAGASGGAINGASSMTVDIGNSSFTNNTAVGSSGAGGGAFSASSTSSPLTLTITASTFTGNTVSGNSSGGALNSSGTSPSAQITDSVFSNNKSGASGGGIRFSSTSTVTLTRTVVSGNTTSGSNSSNGGGIELTLGGSLTLDQSAIVNNTASGTTSGGGSGGAISSSSAAITIINSTISGNLADSRFETSTTPGGGAIRVSSLSAIGGITIRNSTITNNTAQNSVGAATVKGGGILINSTSATAPSILIESSIVAGNFNASNRDLYIAQGTGGVLRDVTGQYNVIGAADLAQFNLPGPVNQVGTEASPLNPGLFALANNGGPTPTHGLWYNSPAIDQGDNSALALANDQRGTGFGRTVDVAGVPNATDGTDAGAHEGFLTIPFVRESAGIVDVLAASGSPYSFTVTYDDETGINTGSLGTGDITITRNNPGTPLVITPTFKGFTSGGGNKIVATYEFTPPGGAWDVTDSDLYTVRVVAGQVLDGSAQAVEAQTIGTFRSLVTGTLMVDKSGDVDDGNYVAGELSLREAIRLSNVSTSGVDTITFAAALNGTTIALTGDLVVTDAVTIQGNGPVNTIVSGGGAGRIFTFAIPLAGPASTFSGLTIRDGAATTAGGAISLDDDSLSLTNVVITNNIVTGAAGGAINMKTGVLQITDSVISGNSSSSTGGGINVSGTTGVATLQITRSVIQQNQGTTGGGINMPSNSSATLTLVDSTVADNTATATGGGIALTTGPATITGSTISGNVANGGSTGGGGLSFNSGTVTITNSTFSGNSSTGATASGGAIRMGGSGTLNLNNATIAYNTAAGNGGGIGTASGTNPTWNFNSTVIAQNDNINHPDLFHGASSSTITINADFVFIGVNTSAKIVVGGANNQVGVVGGELNAKLNSTLAANGGLTKTHALLSDSPLIDAGNNTLALASDQRGQARTFNAPPANVGDGTDIGAYEFQSSALAKVSATQVNDGTPQRSRVTSLRVTFNQIVTFSGAPEAAFQITRQSDGFQPTFTATVDNTGPGTVVTLTSFSGPATEFASLADGRYTLTVLAAQVNGGNFDGNGDGTAGDNFALVGTPANGLFRLFGDVDGDNDVDSTDFGAFRAVYGGSSAVFDFDNDGDVDTSDFGAFRSRFGASV